MAPPRSALPQWARRIKQLRQRIGLTQGAFGARIHCSAMTVSRWESGALEPSAAHYINLAYLAGEPACWEFWSRAGIKTSVLSRMLPRVRERLTGAKQRGSLGADQLDGARAALNLLTEKIARAKIENGQVVLGHEEAQQIAEEFAGLLGVRTS